MRKPTISVGTLFSLDTASALNAELALSFEGDGSEIRAYYLGTDKKFDLGLNVNNWIVLGFSWSWSNGNMSFNLAIDNDMETITIENVAPYMDTLIGATYWGNSRITEFGLGRLFATFLEVYIHSIHIRGAPGTFPPFPDLEFRIPGLWTCAWDTFLDEADG